MKYTYNTSKKLSLILYFFIPKKLVFFHSEMKLRASKNTAYIDFYFKNKLESQINVRSYKKSKRFPSNPIY